MKTTETPIMAPLINGAHNEIWGKEVHPNQRNEIIKSGPP